MRRIKLIILLVTSSIFLSGCFDVDKIVIDYDVKEDLSGKASFTYYGVKSTDPSVEKQKEELNQFIETDIPNMVEDSHTPTIGLKNKSYTILNKTETTCDVQCTGNFDNFLEALPFSSGEIKPKIERDESKVSVILIDNITMEEKQEIEVTLSIKYDGKIIEHNAHNLDKETNTMFWNITELKDQNISFVIKNSQLLSN
ncbi:MAG: hypothetical protein KAH64_03880 [Nitrosomonadaceae bacterium]|nr:hypothetical protein [Nitrosomonadaceae bacterium]